MYAQVTIAAVALEKVVLHLLCEVHEKQATVIRVNMNILCIIPFDDRSLSSVEASFICEPWNGYN